MRVAAGAIDHRARDAARLGDPRQNVAPDGRVLAAAVVQHDNVPGRHIVDVVAHRPGGISRRPVKNREGAARQAELRVQWLDVEALPRDAQPIQRVADRSGVELRSSRTTLLSFVITTVSACARSSRPSPG